MTTKSKAAQNRGGKCLDDTRRPVWLEATESFYKKLNRIAKECELSRYEALSRGLDALLRETQVRNSALNRNSRSPPNRKYFAGPWDKSRGIIGRLSARKSDANGRERVRRRDGAGEPRV